MAVTSEQAEYSVQMLVTDWLLIDGTMDNHVQSAVDGAVPDGMEEGGDAGEKAQEGDGHEGIDGWDEDGEGDGRDESPGWDAEAEIDGMELPRVAQLGTSIRQAGWDQIPGWPHDGEGFKTWPAPGQMATLTLTGTQWNLVVFALQYWADVDERLSDVEGATKSRAIATAVEQRLAEHGWATESTLFNQTE